VILLKSEPNVTEPWIVNVKLDYPLTAAIIRIKF